MRHPPLSLRPFLQASAVANTRKAKKSRKKQQQQQSAAAAVRCPPPGIRDLAPVSNCLFPSLAPSSSSASVVLFVFAAQHGGLDFGLGRHCGHVAAARCQSQALRALCAGEGRATKAALELQGDRGAFVDIKFQSPIWAAAGQLHYQPAGRQDISQVCGVNK